MPRSPPAPSKPGNPRHEALLYFLRNIDPTLADGVYREVGLKYKKAKKWAKAVDCLRQIARSEAFDNELRYELSVCNIKQSAKDLAPHLRAEDHALRGFQALLQDKKFKLFDRLKKEKALDAADFYYVGFHFSEGTGRRTKFGRNLLEYVAKRWPKTKEGKAARNKLKLAPQSQIVTPHAACRNQVRTGVSTLAHVPCTSGSDDSAFASVIHCSSASSSARAVGGIDADGKRLSTSPNSASCFFSILRR